MKALALIFAALLLQFTVSQSCASGYYATGVPSSKCVSCQSTYGHAVATCAISPTFTYTLKSQIVGAGIIAPSTVPVPYCSGSYYNKATNNCQVLCKLGCKDCSVDYDFCTDCTSGFYWNNDYTCLPAGVGLLAASLAFLVIGLIFLIATCCLVNKSRK